jgi:hypothetical protein
MRAGDFESNSVYQGIYEQARVKEAQEVLLRLLRRRLGEPSPGVLSRIRALDDSEELYLLLDRYDRVPSWDQLFPTPEAQGYLNGVAASLVRLGCKKFGPPGERVEAAIGAITDLDRLRDLIDRVLDVSSWDELLAPRGPSA